MGSFYPSCGGGYSGFKPIKIMIARRRVEEEVALTLSDTIDASASIAKANVTKGFWGTLLKGLLEKFLSQFLENLVQEILSALKQNDKIDISLRE